MRSKQHPHFGLTSEEEQQRMLNREVKVALEIAKLNLPHVVKLHAYTDSAGPTPDTAVAQAKYALVMEHCELGSVKDVMRKLTWRNPAFKVEALDRLEAIALEWQRLVRDLSIINKAGIVLQDISKGNILLTGEGKFKFCDFGYSWLLSEDSDRYAGVGTNLCRSVLRQQSHHDPRGDLFALGMVLLAFFTSLAGCPFNPLMLTHLKKGEVAQQADLRQLLVDTVVLGQRMMRLSPQLDIVPELKADSLIWYMGAWILLLSTLDSPGMPSGYHLDHAEVASLLGNWHIVAVKYKNIQHGEAVLPALAKLQSRLLRLSLWNDEFKDEQLRWMALEYATLSSPLIIAQGDSMETLLKSHFGADNPVPQIMQRIDSYSCHFFRLCSMACDLKSKYFLRQEELMLARPGGLLLPAFGAAPSRAPKQHGTGEGELSPVDFAAHEQGFLVQQAPVRQQCLNDQQAGPTPRQQKAEQGKARLALEQRGMQDLYTDMPGLDTLWEPMEQIVAEGTDGQPAKPHAPQSSAAVHPVAGLQPTAAGMGGCFDAAALPAPRVPQEDGQRDSLGLEQHGNEGVSCQRLSTTRCPGSRSTQFRVWSNAKLDKRTLMVLRPHLQPC